eukprot:CAMPEP_0117421574 /NCGR_PEP_ID=MMETSP0758-20121206/2624_1 /TAXON_ID=63605 /ORGANISM="Percolomonas cosmopolitus, Strain AE-1 (ATCC 50343)" /LENGTH=785 /DNA_ID=CAMNT_0005203751 /DNA_START=269 /DNA_END=2626 /DNA_ORIENTATION=+
MNRTSDGFVVPGITGSLYMYDKDLSHYELIPKNISYFMTNTPVFAKDGTQFFSSRSLRPYLIDWGDAVVEKLPLLDKLQFYRSDYQLEAKGKWTITFSDLLPVAEEEDDDDFDFDLEIVSQDQDDFIRPFATYATTTMNLMLRETSQHPESMFRLPSLPIKLFQIVHHGSHVIQLHEMDIPLLPDKHIHHNTKDGLSYVYIGQFPNAKVHYAQDVILEKSNHYLTNYQQALPSSTSLEDRSTLMDEIHFKFDGFKRIRRFTHSGKLPTMKFIPMLHEHRPNLHNQSIVQSSKRPLHLPYHTLEPKPKPLEKPKGKFMEVSGYLIVFGVMLFFIILIMLYLRFYKKRNDLRLSTTEETLRATQAQLEALQKEREIEEKKAQLSNSEVNNDQFKVIGSIKLYKKRVIGHGSNGTMVYEGELSGRKIAVKRILKEHTDNVIIQREITLLIESDEHDHIVRYYAKEEDDTFIYIGLELCESSLAHAIENTSVFDSSIMKKQVIEQLTSAVHHLHALHIVHRDLKPQNVLVDAKSNIRVTDMGLGKKVNPEQSSFHTYTQSGTIGWHAPEVIGDGKQRKTKAVDCFSLGCIMYYILTNGKHPFGDVYQREHNILQGQYCLNALKKQDKMAKHLISMLISKKPEERPSLENILHHPFFWSSVKKIEFLSVVSSQLGKDREKDPLFQRIQKKAPAIYPNNSWDKRMSSTVIKEVCQHRNYNYQQVWDLLRLIRNISAHFMEYSLKMRKEMEKPDMFHYFHSRFPNLFPNIYFLVDKYWSKRPAFQPFFPTTS